MLAPFPAGYFRIGHRDGPAFYPEPIHSILYGIGFGLGNNGEKPRMGMVWGLYDRPLFWGLPRRPKPIVEREAYIQRLIERKGPDDFFTKRLLKEQEDIKAGVKKHRWRSTRR